MKGASRNAFIGTDIEGRRAYAFRASRGVDPKACSASSLKSPRHPVSANCSMSGADETMKACSSIPGNDFRQAITEQGIKYQVLLTR